MRRCDACGLEAKFVVGIQVEVYDLETGRRRMKMMTISLCEEHEGNSREFFARDRDQKRRIAQAISPKLEHVWQKERLR